MAYKADEAFSLIQGAFQRERLAHAFLITGANPNLREDLASKVIGLVRGENVQASAAAPELETRESGLTRIVRPKSKSRVIKVENMRELERSFYQASGSGNWKVGVVVESDRMNEAAANAFLKTLEEPPEDSLLLFLSGQPGRLLPTILSRCVRIDLIPDTGGADANLPNWVRETTAEIARCFPDGFGKVSNALQARSVFSEVLAQRKDELSSRYASDLKDEQTRYKKVVEGDYLKERENYYKALLESDYLRERNLLLDGILLWFADVVRLASGTDRLDLPELESLTRLAADSTDLSILLQRSGALDALRQRLETNAMEALALDVGFLDAFA